MMLARNTHSGNCNLPRTINF